MPKKPPHIIQVDVHDTAQLDALTEEQLNSLPVGAIRVDADGRILFYSRTEAAITGRDPERVLGRNFFHDVAPCTAVPEFYGRFRRGVLTGALQTTFGFVFDFDMHPVRVRISMRNAEREGEYWIIVEPLEQLQQQDASAARAIIAGKYHDKALGGASLHGFSVDFSRCEDEPIAFCGTVQPYGCLLVLEPTDLRVIAASANTERFLGRQPQEVLNATLAEVLPAGDGGLTACLRARHADPTHFCPGAFQTPPQPGQPDLALNLQLTRWRNRLLLEIEPHAEMAQDQRLAAFDFADFGLNLLRRTDIADISAHAVRAFRHLTDFERVLIYRFESNWDGVVIAEDMAPDTLSPVLGLRYPASDIPRQARALYAETLVRYMPSRDHANVPLLALDAEATDIDIGAAQLRTSSPLHRAYQERFGVNGSMSLSLVSDGHLWGLVIFHHRAPHPVTMAQRRRLAEFAGLLSARIALLDERARLHAREQGIAAVNAIIGQIDLSKPFPRGFQGNETLLRDLFNADSMQIFHRDRPLVDSGETGLSADDQRALLRFLRGRGGGVWSTDCLSGEFEPAAAYPDALAGLIAVFIGPEEDYVMLFGRRCTRYDVRWGSDPASLAFSDTSGLWPDRRFRVWTETRTHHARPWSPLELGTAEALRTLTQEVIVASAAHFEGLALRDSLTLLPNRERFRQQLAEAIDAAEKSGQVFGIGLLDIDHFKTVNDTLGHDKGDVLLRAAAERIADALPAAANVARLGGDEFALLLPPGHEDALDAMPRKVVEAFREPIIVGEDRFTVTVSMGITIGHGGSAGTDLLKQADMALYQAKDAGRNCVRAFDSGLQQRALARLEITREILGRSPNDAVEILLQPQVPITAHERLPRFEVLARWRTAEGRLLLPNDFIEAAQQSGIMREVTDAVLRKAINVLQTRLNQADGRSLLLSVNVTGTDLEARWFARNLLAQLDEADVPRSLLELDIHEAMLLRMTPSVRESLRQLSSGGVPLALDNFGSGFSSMTHLRELSIATLKIDRNLVRGISNEQDRRLVAGIIAMAHSLGKTVIAQGVERITELETLRRLDCDLGQGFLWSKPLPPAEALDGRWQPSGGS